MLSTFSYPNEGQVGHFDSGLPSWLAIGGDLRSVNIVEEGEDEPSYRFIPMQRDIEVAAGYREIWFGGSYGIYNDRLSESRRHYIVVQNVANRFTLRAGKFTPAYGINSQDHTAANRGRLALGEGDESYNLEASTKSPLGQIFLTGIAATKETNEKGEIEYTSNNSGFAARTTAFILPKLQLGYSVMIRTLDIKYGGFMSFAIGKWLYGATDINELIVGEKRSVLTYSKLSVQVYRGISLFYENNYSKTEISNRENNLGVDFFPRPHFEFLAKGINRDGRLGALLMSHYYF